MEIIIRYFFVFAVFFVVKTRYALTAATSLLDVRNLRVVNIQE